MGRSRLNIIGHKFGQLTVIAEILPKGHTRKYFCKCDCGNTSDVFQTSLRNGNSQSCGHRIAEVATKHGESLSRIYNIHKTMIQRCTNPNDQAAAHYHDRGITIHEPWMDYETFRDWALANGYADNLSIDRINTNGNYTPENCRWATPTTQARNQSKRGNTSSKYHGVSHEKTRDRWRATIKPDGVSIFIGRFKTEIEAAQARDNYITTQGLKDFPLNKDLF